LRYYDPSTCRWVTPDPIGIEGGSNLYAYVLNNPLTYFDLLGLSPEVDSWMSYEVDKISSRMQEREAPTRDRDTRPRGNWDNIKDSFSAFASRAGKSFVNPEDIALAPMVFCLEFDHECAILCLEYNHVYRMIFVKRLIDWHLRRWISFRFCT
jgi:hypothetical protein